MGRTTNPIDGVVIAADEPFTGAEARVISQIQHEGAALAAEQQTNAKLLAQRLGYPGSIDPGALEDAALASKERVAGELFTLGTQLLLLKEQSTHGEFVVRLGRIGVQPRAAQKFMQATLRFSNAPTSAHLERIGKSKLLELAVLDDDDIKELAEGGTVANLTLDDVDRMAVRDLRAALREARDNEAARGRVMAEKDAKINDLATRLTKAERKRLAEIERATPDEKLQDILLQLDARTFSARAAIQEVAFAVEVAMAHAQFHGGDMADLLSGHLAQLTQDIGGIRETHQLLAAPDGLTQDERIRRDQAEWLG